MGSDAMGDVGGMDAEVVSPFLAPLPEWLRARCRVLGSASDRQGAVVYWMRVGMRDHENPALDVALTLAEALHLPVQVIQVLSERYPYASDRHHTFILEGARDVAKAFEARNIPYAFHLERPGARSRVLRELATRACVVVTELMPVAPLHQWTLALSKVATVIEVDASCIFPMTTGLPAAPTRAFVFRKASATAVSRSLEQGYPTFHFREKWIRPRERLPFTPIDFSTADISKLVATAEIDHGVGPVPDSPGGSAAGYKRWSKYVKVLLHRYAATRNDPLLDTTSRMSAYLHYGQVSPFRLAAELYAAGRSNPGAEKLLDELLIWRELAFHHAFHAANHAEISSLPDWALATLKAHESDPRSALPSWEELANARSEDPLWNACQRSLLAHGELHNNLRMTWGKRMIHWTETAEDAFGLLLDLNHRYALDGRDPASYAGIRWCFGAFDRPFSPEIPVLGSVRPRPTAIHEERLNLPAYDAWVRRSPFKRSPRVLVLGSGIAGLAAARTLRNHNVEVVVFDKGRRPGGRMVSRYLQGIPFDYGAQYFTARSPAFQRLVGSLVWEGVLSVWTPRVARLFGDAHQAITAEPHLLQAPGTDPQRPQGSKSDPSLASRDDTYRFASSRYAPSPWHIAPRGFSSFMDRLAIGLDVRQSKQAVACARTQTGSSWRVTFADGSIEEADELLITVPCPQVEGILGRRISPPRLHTPCWSLSVAFSQSLQVPFDAGQVEQSDLAWICRETSKPGRSSNAVEVWTLHASTAFSESRIETNAESVKQELLAAFFKLLSINTPPEIVDSHLHKWRFARPGSVSGPASFSATIESSMYESGLGIAGDAFGGPRVESAYLSGVDLAGRLLRTLADEGAGSRQPFSFEARP